jgi:hypothetical protein
LVFGTYCWVVDLAAGCLVHREICCRVRHGVGNSRVVVPGVHTKFIGDSSGDGILFPEDAVRWWTISTHLSYDELAVSDNLNRLPVVYLGGPQSFTNPPYSARLFVVDGSASDIAAVHDGRVLGDLCRRMRGRIMALSPITVRGCHWCRTAACRPVHSPWNSA